MSRHEGRNHEWAVYQAWLREQGADIVSWRERQQRSDTTAEENCAAIDGVLEWIDGEPSDSVIRAVTMAVVRHDGSLAGKIAAGIDAALVTV